MKESKSGLRKKNDAFVADEIEKFKNLLYSGAINQKEYDQKKKQLLRP